MIFAKFDLRQNITSIYQIEYNKLQSLICTKIINYIFNKIVSLFFIVLTHLLFPYYHLLFKFNCKMSLISYLAI